MCQIQRLPSMPSVAPSKPLPQRCELPSMPTVLPSKSMPKRASSNRGTVAVKASKPFKPSKSGPFVACPDMDEDEFDDADPQEYESVVMVHAARGSQGSYQIVENYQRGADFDIDRRLTLVKVDFLKDNLEDLEADLWASDKPEGRSSQTTVDIEIDSDSSSNGDCIDTTNRATTGWQPASCCKRLGRAFRRSK